MMKKELAVDRWEEKNNPREQDPAGHKPERVPSGSVQSDPIKEQAADGAGHKARKGAKRTTKKSA
jgi:hypothetical protein